MCGHPLEDVQRARDPPLNIFPAYKHQLPIAPQLRGAIVNSMNPVYAGMLSGLMLCRQPLLWVHVFNSLVTSNKHCFAAVFSDFRILQSFSPPLLQWSLNFEGEIQMSHWGWSTLKSLIFFTVVNCGSLINRPSTTQRSFSHDSPSLHPFLVVFSLYGSFHSLLLK